jgi:hypothetical protein
MGIGLRIGARMTSTIGVGIGGVGSSPATLVAGFGDSNNEGFVASFGSSGANGLDPALNANTPYITRYNWHGAAGVADPPVFLPAFPGPGDLDIGGVSARFSTDGKMGNDMGIARALETAIAVPAVSSEGLVAATLAVHWLPSTPYPSSGPNLFNLWVTRQHTLEGILGRRLGGAYVDLLPNDTLSAPQSAAAGTNLTALFAAIRAVWPGLPICLPKLSISNLNAANRDTIRALEVTFAASDPLCAFVDVDDLPLIDGLHFPPNGYQTRGERIGFALLPLMGYAPRVAVTTPAMLGWGPGAWASTSLSFANLNTINSYGDERNGDLQIMVIETGVLSGSAIGTPAGWTAVGTLQTTGSAGIFCNVQLFSRAVTTAILNANGGHMPATSYTAADDRNVAKIITVRGPSANPTIDVATPFLANAVGASMSVPGITTGFANELVIVIAGGWAGSSSRTQAITNGTLTGFVQQQDGAYPMPTTDAFVLSFASGAKAAAGATGTTTVTVTGGTTIGWAYTIGIKP